MKCRVWVFGRFSFLQLLALWLIGTPELNLLSKDAGFMAKFKDSKRKSQWN